MTIKEFAQTIGVSPTTVSHAMHGRGRLNPATRRMVVESIAEYGFIPNVNAQRLSHGRTNLVALDFGDTHDFLSDMFVVEMTRGLQDVLETMGYGVLLSGPGEAMNRWVMSRAVDAVVMFDRDAESKIHEIARMGTPCVVIGNRPVNGIPGVGSVVTGLESGARQVARFLVDQGHREIGYLVSGERETFFFEFRGELERLGAPLLESRIIRAGYTPKDGARALNELLAQDNPPTAIFARTDGLAAGVLSAAHRLGVRVPDELSIVGHDDVPFAELVEPPLTTVRIDCIKLARMASDILFSLLNEPNALLGRHVVNTELVIRGTVSAPRANPLALRPLEGKEVRPITT